MLLFLLLLFTKSRESRNQNKKRPVAAKGVGCHYSHYLRNGLTFGIVSHVIDLRRKMNKEATSGVIADRICRRNDHKTDVPCFIVAASPCEMLGVLPQPEIASSYSSDTKTKTALCKPAIELVRSALDERRRATATVFGQGRPLFTL